MSQLLILYSTVDGHTRRIAQRLCTLLESGGDRVTVRELTPATDVDLAPYDGIVLGASIRYGKHRPEVARLVERNRTLLEAKPSAFFSVNAVARKPEKRTPESNPYVAKFLRQVAWQPAATGIFGGRIDYPSIAFWDRHMIRFIMWITGGPTNLSGTFEFTDWKQVEAFGEEVGRMLRGEAEGEA